MSTLNEHIDMSSQQTPFCAILGRAINLYNLISSLPRNVVLIRTNPSVEVNIGLSGRWNTIEKPLEMELSPSYFHSPGKMEFN